MKEARIISRKLNRQILFCRLILFGESLVCALWGGLTFLAAIFAVLLLDILPSLPFWLHILFLLSFALASVWIFYRGGQKLVFPSCLDALCRLEEDNRLAHRPLRSLDDTPSNLKADPESMALWKIHRARLEKISRQLVIFPPRPVLSHADPLALRMLAGVVLFVAFVMAGEDRAGRLTASILPVYGGAVDIGDVKLTAWMTPPEYTGLAPVFLPAQTPEAQEAGPVLVDSPEGSELIIQISNSAILPVLEINKQPSPDIQKNDARNFRYAQQIQSDGLFEILAGGKRLAHWKLILRPDRIPRVTFTRPISETSRKQIQISFRAVDDYGIENLRLRVRRAPVAGETLPDEIYSYPVILPGGARDYIESVFRKDLTSHPWSGTQVLLDLVAADAVGNKGTSGTRLIVLPQIVFLHPVAREIISQRTLLALNPAIHRHKVALKLGEIGDRPGAYDFDFTVHLGLRAASLRLIYPTGESEINEVIDLLWQLALRLENGGLSLAEARLRAAQDAVMEALARGASNQELLHLMDELEAAMADYTQALVAKMMENRQQAPQSANPAETLSPQDLRAMLARVRDLMQMGMKDAAQRLLSEIQQIMANLQAGMPQKATARGLEALEMIQGLKDIIQGQRELMERSYRKMQYHQDNQPGAPDAQEPGGANGGPFSDVMSSPEALEADLQQKLRQELNHLMQGYEDLLSNKPPAFNRADKAMEQAEKALRKGNTARAVQAEGRALDHLQSVARSLQEQILERFAGEGQLGRQLQGESGEGGRDPFGRKAGTDARNSPEGPGIIPEESEFQKVRSIRDELRRRAGQGHRLPNEIDYIDRLLQPF